MSRKAKKVYTEDLRKLRAAVEFVEVWKHTELAGFSLHCDEADSLVGLLQAFGYADSAAGILAEHAEGDECGEKHHKGCEPYTFSFELEGFGDDPGWTIVTDGMSQGDAEAPARYLIEEMVADYYPADSEARVASIRRVGVDKGIPSETALFGWHDERSCPMRKGK
ncbi:MULTISPECIES: hypothetical protein [Streptomycetaceae]|uniref:hypothetical protein n=1 Tax=Streptomycetaceae TaxID=2062 RepID=UPI000A921EAF|nr:MULTISPECIES: hypothetical protein [Streptomycetaceae]MYS58744.1 hypothetical protein [Streptomyces sp. SID5468]